jgi:hypothetical protein
MNKFRFLQDRLMFSKLKVFILSFLIFSNFVFAQYQVFTWNNFEDGLFPETFEMAHDASFENVSVVNYMNSTAPSGIQDGIAQNECRRFGLKFNLKSGSQYVKVINPVVLERDGLGVSGKALLQADLFIPADIHSIPYSVAVLAVSQADSGESSRFSFYRFGILKGERIFFSYTHNTVQPIIYKQCHVDELGIKTPGWHRFQIIFDGQDKIICAVDGISVPFSPVMEPTLKKLRPGIMVSSSYDMKGVCFADNLSIQWTTEDIPLPESPWIANSSKIKKIPVATSSNPGINPKRPRWFTSPEEAWTESTSSQRPILVLFYAPKVKAYKKLEELLIFNDSAQELLQKFVLLKIDLDQLQGGVLAQNFHVLRVPCFLIMGLDAKEKAKEIFMQNSDWIRISRALRESLRG